MISFIQENSEAGNRAGNNLSDEQFRIESP